MEGSVMAKEMKGGNMRCGLCNTDRFHVLFARDGESVVTCKNCGLTQVIPRPTRREVESFYHEDFDHFKPYLAQIDVHRKYFRKKIFEIRAVRGSSFDRPVKVQTAFSPSVSSAKAMTELQKTRRAALSLLDIGCALGILLEESREQGIEATGIDVSADAVEYCREKGLMVFQGTLTTAQLPAGKHFDVITAFEVIEHEQDPLGMMRRVYKILNNGGVAIVTTPNHDSLWRKIMGKWWVGYQHPEHINFFTAQSLKELFKRAGFSSVVVKKDSPRLFPLSFLFTRGADYFPIVRWLLKPIGRIFTLLPLPNPINPWDDTIAFGVK